MDDSAVEPGLAEAARRALGALPSGLQVRWVQEGRGAWTLGCHDVEPNVFAPGREEVCIQGALLLVGVRHVAGALPRGPVAVRLADEAERRQLDARVALGSEDLLLVFEGAQDSARVLCRQVTWRPYTVEHAAPLAKPFLSLWRSLGKGGHIERLFLDVQGTVEGPARLRPSVVVWADRKDPRQRELRHPLAPFDVEGPGALRDCRLWMRTMAHALALGTPLLREVYTLPCEDGFEREASATGRPLERHTSGLLPGALLRRLLWAEEWLAPAGLLELAVERTAPEGGGRGACWLTARFEQPETGDAGTTVTLYDEPVFSARVLAALHGWAERIAVEREARLRSVALRT